MNNPDYILYFNMFKNKKKYSNNVMISGKSAFHIP